MMSCMFRPFVAENRAFSALWSWHSPTDSADEAPKEDINKLNLRLHKENPQWN